MAKPTMIDPATALEWARIAARAADDKKATDTVVLEVGKVLSVTDYFVIASGSNTRLVRTIADDVERQLRLQAGVSPIRTEGRRDLSWVLLDYGPIVVHVFSEEMRGFYAIERLYRDVPVVAWAPEARSDAS